MKFFIVLLTMLATVGFFNPLGKVSEPMVKLMLFLCFFAALGLSLVRGISLKGVKYPKIAYWVMMAMIALSPVMATAFHPQPFVTSVITTLPYLVTYGFFFILMKLDVPPKKILNAYIVLCIVSGFVYFANVLTLPNNIFGEPIINEDTSRGIIRIHVVYIEMFPLLVFYSIDRWFETKKSKWLVLMAYASMMIVLSVVRQIILVTALLAVFYFFKNLSWGKRILLCLAIAAVILVVLPQIPMYNTMVELTQSQHEDNEEEENIRITAWRYYTYENQTNALTPFFGNGIPTFGKSRWGVIFDSTTQENGCFLGDVGWAGFFWNFGIFAVAALALMVAKAIFKKKPPSQQYLTYWFIFLGITSFASGPILYTYQIFSVCICFYLVFRPEDETDEKQKTGDRRQETGDRRQVTGDERKETGGFTLPRYPQI